MIKKTQCNHIVILVISTAIFSVSSFAQTQDAPEKVDKVEVTGLRAPGINPYKQAYEFFQALNKNPHDKIAVRMRVVPSDKKLKLGEVKIRLEGDKTSQVIPIAEDGLIEIPIAKSFLDDNAEFISNQKKAALQLHVTIDILPPTNGPWRYRYLAEALDQARDSVKGMMPWYVHWLVPNNWNAASIEFTETGTATVMAANGKQLFRSGKDNKIKMLLDDYLISENPEVIFSAPPKRIGAGLISDMLGYQATKAE